jgi:recombination protein RecA
MATDLDIVKKAGSWFSYDGSKLGQGRETVRQLLLDNPEMMTEIEHKVKTHYGVPTGATEETEA